MVHNSSYIEEKYYKKEVEEVIKEVEEEENSNMTDHSYELDDLFKLLVA